MKMGRYCDRHLGLFHHMIWLLIGLLFIAAFGPVLWLMPGPRERRLSNLRLKARQRGLVVEMTRLEDVRPRPQDRVSSGGTIKRPVIKCAAYRLHLPNATEVGEALRIARDDPQAGALLGPWHAHLPSDWLLVERDAHSATLYWREQVGDESLDERIDTIASLLRGLAAHSPPAP